MSPFGQEQTSGVFPEAHDRAYNFTSGNEGAWLITVKSGDTYEAYFARYNRACACRERAACQRGGSADEIREPAGVVAGEEALRGAVGADVVRSAARRCHGRV